MSYVLFLQYIYIVHVVYCANIDNTVNNIENFVVNKSVELKNATDKTQTTFKHYLRKFNPTVVYERLNEKGLIGENRISSLNLNKIIEGIDETDEILSLQVRHAHNN